MKTPNYLLDRNGKPVDPDTARRRKKNNNKGFSFRWLIEPPRSPLFPAPKAQGEEPKN